MKKEQDKLIVPGKVHDADIHLLCIAVWEAAKSILDALGSSIAERPLREILLPLITNGFILEDQLQVEISQL